MCARPKPKCMTQRRTLNISGVTGFSEEDYEHLPWRDAQDWSERQEEASANERGAASLDAMSARRKPRVKTV